MASINDNSALLLYRVGPVLCCAPCLPVSAIITPPPLTRTPGSRPGHPGIFKHAHSIVTALELRHQFGLDESQRANPGRSIVTTLDNQHVGFHVDEILDVISMPAAGWGTLPALLPRGIFTRTLLHKERIFLYAEFSQLQHIPHSGYLRKYIQQLLESTPPATVTANPIPAAPKSKLATPPRSTATKDTATPVPKQITTKVTAQVDATTNPETSRPQNPTPSTTPTPRPAPSSETRIAKPVPASTHVPLQTASRVRTTAPQAAQTTLLNRTPAIQRDPPRPRPSGTTPLAFQTSKRQRPDTAGNTASQRSTTTPSRDDRTHPIPGILAAILFLVVTGGGIWYALSDDRQASITPQVSEMPSLSLRNSMPADSSLSSNATPIPSVAPRPSPHTQAATPSSLTAQPASPQAQTPSADVNTSPVPSKAVITTSKTPDKPANHYHAHIQKKAHELTITLDIPDKPVPRTAPEKPPAAKTDPNISSKADKAAGTASSASTVPHPKPGKTQNAASQTIEITYIVVKGDTLWDIAKRYVKDPFRYPELARLSKIKNPDLIYPGERVRIIKHRHQP